MASEGGRSSPLTGSESARSTRRKLSKQGVHAASLTHADVAQYFNLPADQACRALGISLTVLKRVCRRLGIERWPFRRVKSLERIMSSVNSGEGKDSTSAITQELLSSNFSQRDIKQLVSWTQDGWMANTVPGLTSGSGSGSGASRSADGPSQPPRAVRSTNKRRRGRVSTDGETTTEEEEGHGHGHGQEEPARTGFAPPPPTEKGHGARAHGPPRYPTPHTLEEMLAAPEHERLRAGWEGSRLPPGSVPPGGQDQEALLRQCLAVLAQRNPQASLGSRYPEQQQYHGVGPPVPGTGSYAAPAPSNNNNALNDLLIRVLLDVGSRPPTGPVGGAAPASTRTDPNLAMVLSALQEAMASAPPAAPQPVHPWPARPGNWMPRQG